MMFYPPFYRYPYNRAYWKNTVSNDNLNQNLENEKASKSDEKKETRTNSDSPFIEIMGVSLYFDDVLLICLLLFLFQEGVDDQWLYIALILLLFS